MILRDLVDLHAKVASPLLNLVMVLAGIPFALKTGRSEARLEYWDQRHDRLYLRRHLLCFSLIRKSAYSP
jgi:hypothetical protein